MGNTKDDLPKNIGPIKGGPLYAAPETRPEEIIADNIRSIKAMRVIEQPTLNIKYIAGVFTGYQISFGDVHIGFGKNMKEAERAATNFTLQLTKALLKYRAEQ